jgi:hypothetical protein
LHKSTRSWNRFGTTCSELVTKSQCSQHDAQIWTRKSGLPRSDATKLCARLRLRLSVLRLHRSPYLRLQMARRILLPAILPDYVIALRSGLGLGFMFVVAAEIMGASEGLGYLLVDGQQLGKASQILAAIIAFAVMGKIADGLLASAARPLLRWQDSHARAAESAANEAH